MNLLALLTALTTLTILANLAEGTEKAETDPPPAGRALYFRGANLEPYDYPSSVQSTFDRRLHTHPDHSILGPPHFWTEPSLRAHYEATAQFRYHSRLFHEQPPFEVWLKEKKLIAAINMMRQTIEVETEREDLNQKMLLRHEMQLGELEILFRAFQIATKLRYGVLTLAMRQFEEEIYRHWMSFLMISQSAEPMDEERRRHVEALKEKVEEEIKEIEEIEEMEGREEVGVRVAAMVRGKQAVDKEKGFLLDDLRVRKPSKQWSHGAGVDAAVHGSSARSGPGEVSRSWSLPVDLPSLSHGDTLEEVKEAATKVIRT